MDARRLVDGGTRDKGVAHHGQSLLERRRKRVGAELFDLDAIEVLQVERDRRLATTHPDHPWLIEELRDDLDRLDDDLPARVEADARMVGTVHANARRGFAQVREALPGEGQPHGELPIGSDRYPLVHRAHLVEERAPEERGGQTHLRDAQQHLRELVAHVDVVERELPVFGTHREHALRCVGEIDGRIDHFVDRRHAHEHVAEARQVRARIQSSAESQSTSSPRASVSARLKFETSPMLRSLRT